MLHIQHQFDSERRHRRIRNVQLATRLITSVALLLAVLLLIGYFLAANDIYIVRFTDAANP